MGPQSFEEHIQHQFDSYCKKTLKLTARDCYRRIKRRGEREIVLSELAEQDLAKLAVTDEYFKDAYTFNVLGYEIAVSDELIAEALRRPARHNPADLSYDCRGDKRPCGRDQHSPKVLRGLHNRFIKAGLPRQRC